MPMAAKVAETVSVVDYGAKPNDGIDDSAAFNKALTYAKATKKALRISGGEWNLTADAVNFAGQHLHIVGDGKPVLKFSGTGRAFVMDTGLGNGSFYQGMTVENLIIVGGPAITDGFYSRGMVRGVFRNIEVREVSGKAFHILHGVSNQYDSLKYSAGGQVTKAAVGLYVTNNGPGYYTADCTFTNMISEDFPGVAAVINDGSGNLFMGGTFEGVNIGLSIGPGSRRNHFVNLWFEVNATRDLEVNSTANTFDDNYFGSASSGPNIEIATGKGTIFRGGYVRTANLQSTSSDTLFLGIGLDENLGGSLGIKGSGTYKIFGATKIGGTGDVVGQMNDRFGPVAGIKFAAPRVASGDVNTLDDYKEGEWTGALIAGTAGSMTMNPTLQTGSYTKIGRVVTVTGIFHVDAVTAPSGQLWLTGLPFAPNAGAIGRAAVAVNGNGLAETATGSIVGQILPADTRIFIRKFDKGVTADLAGDVKAGSQFYISASYVAD